MTTSLSPVETAENDNLINTRSITPGEYQIHVSYLILSEQPNYIYFLDFYRRYKSIDTTKCRF